MSKVNAGHYVVGTQGLGLLRKWITGECDVLQRQLAELGRCTLPGKPPLSIELDVQEHGVLDGYARWSKSYDSAPNPLIRVEQPVVRAWIDAAPPGVALDAACGTGRHTAYLRERGHRVIGVDASPEMLAHARTRVPDADLRRGQLEALPLEDASVDLAVCALALTHARDLTPAIAELTRVLRPGGRLILSDLHPTMVLLGGTGFFLADGAAGNVETFHHPHAAYLAAFRNAGLEVCDCAEPALEEQDLQPLSGGLIGFAPEGFRAAWLGLPNALIWNAERRGGPAR